MYFLRALGLIFIMAMIAILTVSSYFGAFNRVEVDRKNFDATFFVYKTHMGSYHEVTKVMNEAKKFLKEKYNIDTNLSMGIYLDNPEQTETKDLRSMVGYVVTAAQFNEIIETDGLRSGLNVFEIPASDAVYSTFKYKGKPSFIFGVLKIYPAFRKYIESNSDVNINATIEVYDIDNKKINFYIPQSLNYDFFEQLFNSSRQKIANHPVTHK